MKRRITIFALLLSAFSAIGPSVFAAGPDNVMYMRLTPVGYRLGATDDIKDYDPSVVTVSPGEVSNVTSNKPVTLTAALDRDYKVICWQKFDVDPRDRTGADPIEEFGKESETVSISINTNVSWMYVTVVVKYDPVRTVKTSLSSFAKGTITVSPEKTDYQKDDVVTLTAQPAEGYSFVRWSDGNADHIRTLTVDDDIDLKAYIEPISSKVTFSAERDAVLDVTSKRVSYDNAYGDLPTPVRDGLVFTGWIDADWQVVTAKTTVDRTSDHTLSAQWEIPPESYMVVFEPNGGTGVEMRVTQTFEVGVAQKLRVNTFYYPGHVFVGWNQDKAAEEKQYSDEQIVKDLAPAGTSITFYAVWRAEKTAYAVHFEKNAADATGEMIDQQFAGGEEKPLSGCNFKRTGWTFLGWSTDQEAVEPKYQDREKVQDLTTQKELTLYAVWTRNPVYYIEYKLTKDDKDLWKSATVEQGKEYNLVTNDSMRVGYNPSGWKNGDKLYAYGAKLTSQDLRKMADDGDTITFVADWTPITYTVTYRKNDGTDKRYADPKPFTYDQGHALISWADFGLKIGNWDGYDFLGWSLTNEWDGASELYKNGQTVTNLTETAGAVVDLYAIWQSDTPTPPDPPTPVTTNTVTFLTNGVVYVEQKVENGAMVGEPKKPTWDGYVFTGWTNETYTAGFDFTTPITNDLTLVAAWEKNPPPVVDDLKTALGFGDDDPITVTAEPAACWVPAGENTVNLTNDCTITFTVTNGTINVTVEAKGNEGWLRYMVGTGEVDSHKYESDDFEPIVDTIVQGKPLMIWKGPTVGGENSVINSLKCIKK